MLRQIRLIQNSHRNTPRYIALAILPSVYPYIYIIRTYGSFNAYHHLNRTLLSPPPFENISNLTWPHIPSIILS